MKKILLAVTAALAITGCSQNEEFENAGQNAVINFESIVSNATRATEMKLDELKTQGFHVYAYNTGDAVVGTGTLNKSIMENEPVSWNSGDNKWTSNNAYYWPSQGKIQFFAYSSSRSFTLTATDTDQYPTLVNYQIADTAPNQEDLLVAKVTDKTKADLSVNFTFSHVLTQIQFAIKSKLDDKLTYTVSKIEINGVNDKGTYKYADNVWTSLEGSATYIYPLDDITTTNNAVQGTTSKNIGTESLMLLPQTLTTRKMLVSYNVTDKNGDEVYTTGATPKEVDLKDAIWGVGKSIRYTLSLTNDAATIGWDVTDVDKWADEDNQEKDPVAPAV